MIPDTQEGLPALVTAAETPMSDHIARFMECAANGWRIQAHRPDGLASSSFGVDFGPALAEAFRRSAASAEPAVAPDIPTKRECFDCTEDFGCHMNCGPAISLPEGWDWDRVRAECAKWGISDDMIPVATVTGIATAWGTIDSIRSR